MWNSVVRKCTNCHHEDEAVDDGIVSTCRWCKEGTMEVIHTNPKIDHNRIMQILDLHKK